jgi:hypothetical protein
MKEQRNTAQKEGRTDVSIDWEPIPLIEYLTRTHDHYRVSWAGPVGTEPSHAKLPVSTFTLGGSKVEVIIEFCISNRDVVMVAKEAWKPG